MEMGTAVHTFQIKWGELQVDISVWIIYRIIALKIGIIQLRKSRGHNLPTWFAGDHTTALNIKCGLQQNKIYIITVFILWNVKMDTSMRDKAYSSLKEIKSTEGLNLSLLVLGVIVPDIAFSV
jgi:hypothetical protein